MITSLEKISIKDIRTSILTKFGFSEILKHKETINDIIDVLLEHGHLSFFNYHVIEHLVEQFGTKSNDHSPKSGTVSDQDMLKDYETMFIQFCNRSVLEVPQGIFARRPPGGEIIAFKVTNEMAKGDHPTTALHDQLPTTTQVSSKLLNLSLNDTIDIQGRIAKCLGLKDNWSLVFLGALRGCIQLNFSISTSLFCELKPKLSTNKDTEVDPEAGLANLEASGIHLLCGPPGTPSASK